MPITDLLMQGVELMFLGMGIVFGFLILLVLVMSGMSRLSQTLEPEEPSPSMPAASTRPAEQDDTLIAVISTAINMFRTTHR